MSSRSSRPGAPGGRDGRRVLGGPAGRHAAAAGKEITLRLRRGASAVWVEVFYPDLRLPWIRSGGETDEGGRGLYLVDQLATRWGSRPTRDGKAVWFELPVNGAPRLPQ